MPDDPDRTELTSKIVVSYLRCNPVAAEELATVISTVHQALADLGRPAEPVEAELPRLFRFVDPLGAISSSVLTADGKAGSCVVISGPLTASASSNIARAGTYRALTL